jgi:cytochrome P450
MSKMLSAAWSIDPVALIAASFTAASTLLMIRDLFRPLPNFGVVQVRNAGITLKTSGAGREAFFLGLARAGQGRPVAFKMLWLQRVLVSDPADIEHILVRNSGNYSKGEGLELLRRILGDGLVTISDEKLHARQRRLVSPAFSAASLDRIANDIMRDQANQLVQSIRGLLHAGEGAAVIIGDHIHDAALAIIAEAAFHTTCRADTSRIGETFLKILSCIWQPLHMTSIGRRISPRLRECDRLKKKLDAFVTELVTAFKTTGAAATCGTSGRGVLDCILQASADGELSVQNITDHSVTFMFAGFETSSNSVQWMLALLALHRNCQQRLLEELSAVMALGSIPDVAALRGCAYLNAVIHEGLRLHPVVAAVPRYCCDSDVLPSSRAVIPAGTVVLASILAVHRTEQVYGVDVDEFRPERWLDVGVRARVELHNAFLPFGLGKRNCIGKDFAWSEMTILIAAIVRNFSFDFAKGFGFPLPGNSLLNSPQRFGLAMTARKE